MGRVKRFKPKETVKTSQLMTRLFSISHEKYGEPADAEESKDAAGPDGQTYTTFKTTRGVFVGPEVFRRNGVTVISYPAIALRSKSSRKRKASTVQEATVSKAKKIAHDARLKRQRSASPGFKQSKRSKTAHLSGSAADKDAVVEDNSKDGVPEDNIPDDDSLYRLTQPRSSDPKSGQGSKNRGAAKEDGAAAEAPRMGAKTKSAPRKRATAKKSGAAAGAPQMGAEAKSAPRRRATTKTENAWKMDADGMRKIDRTKKIVRATFDTASTSDIRPKIIAEDSLLEPEDYPGTPGIGLVSRPPIRRPSRPKPELEVGYERRRPLDAPPQIEPQPRLEVFRVPHSRPRKKKTEGEKSKDEKTKGQKAKGEKAKSSKSKKSKPHHEPASQLSTENSLSTQDHPLIAPSAEESSRRDLIYTKPSEETILTGGRIPKTPTLEKATVAQPTSTVSQPLQHRTSQDTNRKKVNFSPSSDSASEESPAKKPVTERAETQDTSTEQSTSRSIALQDGATPQPRTSTVLEGSRGENQKERTQFRQSPSPDSNSRPLKTLVIEDPITKGPLEGEPTATGDATAQESSIDKADTDNAPLVNTAAETPVRLSNTIDHAASPNARSNHSHLEADHSQDNSTAEHVTTEDTEDTVADDPAAENSSTLDSATFDGAADECIFEYTSNTSTPALDFATWYGPADRATFHNAAVKETKQLTSYDRINRIALEIIKAAHETVVPKPTVTQGAVTKEEVNSSSSIHESDNNVKEKIEATAAATAMAGTNRTHPMRTRSMSCPAIFSETSSSDLSPPPDSIEPPEGLSDPEDRVVEPPESTLSSTSTPQIDPSEKKLMDAEFPGAQPCDADASRTYTSHGDGPGKKSSDRTPPEKGSYREQPSNNNSQERGNSRKGAPGGGPPGERPPDDNRSNTPFTHNTSSTSSSTGSLDLKSDVTSQRPGHGINIVSLEVMAIRAQGYMFRREKRRLKEKIDDCFDSDDESSASSENSDAFYQFEKGKEGDFERWLFGYSSHGFTTRGGSSGLSFEDPDGNRIPPARTPTPPGQSMMVEGSGDEDGPGMPGDDEEAAMLHRPLQERVEFAYRLGGHDYREPVTDWEIRLDEWRVRQQPVHATLILIPFQVDPENDGAIFGISLDLLRDSPEFWQRFIPDDYEVPDCWDEEGERYYADPPAPIPFNLEGDPDHEEATLLLYVCAQRDMTPIVGDQNWLWNACKDDASKCEPHDERDARFRREQPLAFKEVIPCLKFLDLANRHDCDFAIVVALRYIALWESNPNLLISRREVYRVYDALGHSRVRIWASRQIWRRHLREIQLDPESTWMTDVTSKSMQLAHDVAVYSSKKSVGYQGRRRYPRERRQPKYAQKVEDVKMQDAPNTSTAAAATAAAPAHPPRPTPARMQESMLTSTRWVNDLREHLDEFEDAEAGSAEWSDSERDAEENDDAESDDEEDNGEEDDDDDERSDDEMSGVEQDEGDDDLYSPD